MSLILDALKRSDRERRVAAGEPFAASTPRRRRMGVVPVLLLVLLLGLLIAVLWLWRTDGWSKLTRLLPSGEPAAAEATVQTDADSAPVAAPAEPISTPEPGDGASAISGGDGAADAAANPTTPALVATATPTVELPQPRPAASRPQPEQPVAARQNDNRASRNSRRAEPDPPQQTAPLEIYQLPMGIRLQVPPLTMNVHVYAGQPENRFVLINMQRVEEGDEIEGVIARAIRPDGILLEFQGHEFLLRRP